MYNDINFNDGDIQGMLFGGDAEFRRKHLDLINKIQRWIYPDVLLHCLPDNGGTRYASSLITRAELALFGLSSPRFCIRYYLDKQHHSFYNLRRSALLKHNFDANAGWAERTSEVSRHIREATISPDVSSIDKPGLIGDSVLAVPAKFSGDYRVLGDENLYVAYGEIARIKEGRKATPYVQHFWATGLCSHAVIYIGSLLLEKYIKNIHALADISALLRNQNNDELLIVGLSPHHIEKVFEHGEIGLKSIYQIAPPTHSFPAKDHKDYNQELCFRCALRSYLFSSMPVIKHVDAGRLHGKNIKYGSEKWLYQRNSTEWVPDYDPAYPEPHCVILIGAAAAQARSEDFLLHDPGGFPYLEASSAELMHASSYVDDSQYNEEQPNLTQLFFQPITPGAVEMHLHRHAVKRGKYMAAKPGLYQITLHYYRDHIDDVVINSNLPQPREFMRGEFRLVTAPNILNSLTAADWSACVGPLTIPVFRDAIESLQNYLAGRDGGHWYWVQRFSSSCWIWDAQLAPPESDNYVEADVLKYLVGIVTSAGHCHRFQNVAEVRPDINVHDRSVEVLPKQAKHLDVGLLTSFTAHGLAFASTNGPWDMVKNAELYTFMQPDVGELLIAGNPNRISAVNAMNDLVGDDAECTRIAEGIVRYYDPERIKITSFATFIPGLLSAKPRTQESARRALIFLCELANKLRGMGHPAHTIEIIGGSIIDGVLCVDFTDEDGSKTECILANRLKTTTRLAAKLLEQIVSINPHLVRTKTRIAIETEPGILFAFRDTSAVTSLAANIETEEKGGNLEPGFVGFNLDIGHWMLSNIEPSILHNALIRDRIFGVHVTDHAKGHFGDTVVGGVHEIPVFRDWLRELAALQSEKSLRGVVTVEFECAKNKELLRQAIDNVIPLL